MIKTLHIFFTIAFLVAIASRTGFLDGIIKEINSYGYSQNKDLLQDRTKPYIKEYNDIFKIPSNDN